MIGRLRLAWAKLRSRFWLSLIVDSLLIVLVFLAIHGWQTRHLPIDEPAPQTVLARMDASGLQSAVAAEKTGVIYFFAPWCFYCEASIGNLQNLVDSGRIAWGTVVALDYGSLAEVEAFVRKTGVELPVLMGNEQTAVDWNIRAFPTYYVIDGQGRINSRSVGYSTWLGMWARAWWAD